jgi:hypothetical protein
VLLPVGLRGENTYHLGFTLLAPLIRGPCRRLILACAPHVRLLLLRCDPLLLVGIYWPTSAAIWKRDVLAVVISTAVWTIDGGFLIYGRSPILRHSWTRFRYGCVLGVSRVNQRF